VVKADMTKYISYDISPVAAIDFLRDELSTDSRTSGAEIHALMHVVGSALYDSQGLEGLVVCLDHPLGIDVPCFHGLMLQFFRNVSSVTALDADTFKGLCSGMMISDCLNIYHGFGHGYTTYFGYDRQKALDQCLRLSGDVRGYACMQGVNMEWSEYAPFEKIEERRAKPWSLCTELRDARERGLCAFEMPRTLSFLYYGKQDLLFDLYAARDAVSDGCRAAPSAWWRALCFRGIGFMAAMRSSPEANTADICTSMPEATVADVHLCLMSAAQRLALIGTPDVAPDAYAVCKVLIRDFREKQCKHFFPDMELGSEN
jgi:hypothetical protein